MSVHVTDDSLKLLTEELESTLQRVQLGLEAYLEDPTQVAVLASVTDWIDQLRGAFTMLDRPDAASFLEETGALARWLTHGEAPKPGPAQEALLQAVLQMPRYLEWLRWDNGKKPLFNLLPLTNQLRIVHGLGSIQTEQATPALAEAGRRDIQSSRCELVTQLRPALQRALLGVLRGQGADEHLEKAAEIFAHLKKAAPNKEEYHLWWLAEGLALEARHNGTVPGPEANRLLRDLDRHIGQLIASDTVYSDAAAAQELSRRLTRCLANTEQGAVRLEKRIDYHPPPIDPAPLSQPLASGPALLDIKTVQQIGIFLRESLISVRDCLDRLARTNPRRADMLQGELERLHETANVLTLLNMYVSAGLIRRHLTVLQQWLTTNDPISEEEVLQLASELRLVEDSLDGISEFAYEQDRPAVATAEPDDSGKVKQLSTSALPAQAEAALHQEPEEVRPEPMVAAKTISVMPASIVNTVDPEFIEVFFEEAQGELVNIREQLLAWRKDLTDRTALSSLRRSFHTLKGSGRMVGQLAIGEFAWHIEDLLNRVMAGQLTASAAIVAIIDEAQAVLAGIVSAGPADDEGGLPVLTALTARIETLLSGETPIEPPLSVPALETAAPQETVLPENTLPPSTPARLEETTEAIAEPDPLTTAPIPASPAISAPEQDQELLEAFLDEAAEILDTGEVTLQRWSADRENPELLNNLRRDMHTLKGSARMVGLRAIGDLAHAMESLLDAIATASLPASTAMVAALQRALDGLNGMLAQVRNGLEPLPAQDLLDALKALARTETQQAAPPTTVSQEVQAKIPPDTAPPAVFLPVPDRQPSAPDQELLAIYLSEATGILDASRAALQDGSADRENPVWMNDLWRYMHTLTGSSRMAGLRAVGDLAHAMESLLGAIATAQLPASVAAVAALQRALDGLNGMLAQVRNGLEPLPAQDLLDALKALAGMETQQAIPPVAVPQAESPVKPGISTAKGTDSIRVSAALLNTLVNRMGESSTCRARIDEKVGTLHFSLAELNQTVSRLHQQLRRLEIETEAQILFRYTEGAKDHHEDFDPLELDRFSELQQLSRSLMEVVDDLTNIQHTVEEHAQDMRFLLDQQAKINKEVQQGLMQTRLVRFSSVVPRLRRVVRQSCQESGKPAELVLQGAEAEVDRTVLENIVAPLEHLLRNAIAHGIEPPEQRRAAGKPEVGTITMALYREGAELVLQLSDDGAGLDFAAIRAKGETSGLLSPGQPVSEQELIGLLLRPGFSTASQVTQLAGRGVGMDVVSGTIKAMRGALRIQSEPSKGTRFIIRLPFSLAVTQALLVQAGDDIYAVPLLSIEAVTRLEEAEWSAYLDGKAVEHQYGRQRYPLHSLGMLFGHSGTLPFGNDVAQRSPALLFRSAEASAALQVETVLGSQEIIVKPLNPQLHAVPGISGATVLADGRVVVVLELAALVRNLASRTQQQTEFRALRLARQESRQERLSAMVIDDSITMRKVTARVLERHNINVTVAKDGMEAVALLEEQVPDLVILDIEMPRMDGFEVVAHIRNQPRLRHLAVIMVTSRSGEKHRERATRLGVDDYLIKPYQEEELMRSIRTVLGGQGLKLAAEG